MRFITSILFTILLFLHSPIFGNIRESATPGPSAIGGALIGGNDAVQQILGWRFSVTAPITITKIGGNLNRSSIDGYWGMIYNLGGNTFPTTLPPPISAFEIDPNVIAFTTMTPPNPSTDPNYLTAIGPVTIGPGNYALMYGSNAYGLTGLGAAALTNPQTDPNYFYWTLADGTWNNLAPPTVGARFAFEFIVPEPSTYLLMGTLLGFTIFLARKKLTA